MGELLLDYDCDANVTDSMKRTPLHVTAVRGDAACVALLLRCRADPLRRGGDGNSLALELVSADHAARAHQLLSAYTRQAPQPLRTDARFDLPGGNDILSAYKEPVPWALCGTPVRQVFGATV